MDEHADQLPARAIASSTSAELGGLLRSVQAQDHEVTNPLEDQILKLAGTDSDAGRAAFLTRYLPARRVREKLQELLQTGCIRLGLENGIFARVEGDRYVVEQAASESHPELDGLVCCLNDTICREVVLRDEPVAFEHAAASEWRHHPGYLKHGAEAYIGTPVKAGSAVYGALCFTSSRPGIAHAR